ncbi:MerR family transcriptional regulator [Microbacter sp. GSS18]|nr:MerR family transcriptional regulator [Microbacter sp. GSS18]
MAQPREFDENAPIFAIAAAAELAGMHPQTLRQYDRLGLVVPDRTRGGSRRYSLRHVAQLREVARMSAEGIGLPAIARILDLEDQVRSLTGRVNALEERIRAEVENRPGARVFAAGRAGGVIPLRHGTRVRRATEVVVWRPRPSLPPAEGDEPDESEHDEA